MFVGNYSSELEAKNIKVLDHLNSMKEVNG